MNKIKYLLLLFLLASCSNDQESSTDNLSTIEVEITMGGDYENFDSALNITAPGSQIRNPQGQTSTVITLFDLSTARNHIFESVNNISQITVQVSLGELKLGINESNSSTILVEVTASGKSIGTDQYTVRADNSREVVTVIYEVD